MRSLKFSCPDDLRELVRREARRLDASESQVIRQALRTYFRLAETREFPGALGPGERLNPETGEREYSAAWLSGDDTA